MKRYLFFAAILGMAAFGLALVGCADGGGGGGGGGGEPGLLTVHNLPTGGWTITVYTGADKGRTAATAAVADNPNGRSPFKLSTIYNTPFMDTNEYYVEIIVGGAFGGTKGADRVRFTNGSAVVDWNEMTVIGGNNNNNNGGNNNGNNAGNNGNNNNNAGNNNGNNNNNGGNNVNENFAGTWNDAYANNQLVITNDNTWTVRGMGQNIAKGSFNIIGGGVLEVIVTNWWYDNAWGEDELSTGRTNYEFLDNARIEFTPDMDFLYGGLLAGTWTRM
jgi:hypothetical protein